MRKNNKYIKYFVNRKFAVDARQYGNLLGNRLHACIFVTSKSIEAALVGLGLSAVLEILFGGLYGKFNDWFRRKAGVKDYNKPS